MILKNKWLDEFRGFEYYNGSIGIIQDIQQDSPRITIKLTDKSDRIVHIDPVTWQNIEYESVKDESDYTKIQAVTIGTYTQFPLKLAWAITIHKSQGLSFESIIADIGWTQPGLVYVALSRCRKLSGLFLKSDFMNDTPKGLIERQVMLEMKMLLETTDMSVKEIAGYLNFEDGSYMCRFFKRHTGISLIEYRRIHQ